MYLSQTHRITEFLRVEGIYWDLLVQPYCSNRVSYSRELRVMSSQILNISKDGDSVSSLVNLFSVWLLSQWKKIFLLLKIISCISVHAYCLLLASLRGVCLHLYFPAPATYTCWWDSPQPSFLYAEHPSSLCLSIYVSYVKPLVISMILHWSCSRMSIYVILLNFIRHLLTSPTCQGPSKWQHNHIVCKWLFTDLCRLPTCWGCTLSQNQDH